MIEYTLDWYKGEIFEGKFILAFGAVAVICALLFRYLDYTPYSKALLIPLLITGVIFSSIGVTMIISNQKKMIAVEQKFEKNQKQFVLSERKRVENFQYLYPLSLAISALCFALAIVFLGFTKSIYFHASGIAIALCGLAFMTIDYFSKERSAIYYEKIMNLIF